MTTEPNPSELEVLKALWSSQRLSAREIHDRIGEAQDWSYSTTRTVIQRMVDKGMIEQGVICPIWESPEITSGPFTARKNLPQELKDAMKAAVMSVQDKDEEAFKMMTGWKAEDPNPQTGWIEVDHERYQWIVDMRDWLKKQRRS